MVMSFIKELEAGSQADRVQIGVSSHVARFVPAGGDSPAQDLHRLARLGLAVGDCEAGAGVDCDTGEQRVNAGDVIDIDGTRVRQPLEDIDRVPED